MSKLRVTNLQDHTFVDSVLGPESVILDCGGFHGGFCEAITQRFHCMCHVLEPSPTNFDHIPELPGIIKHPLALSTKNGVAEFHLAESPICNSLKELAAGEHLETVQVKTTTLQSFLEAQGILHVDLLKLDIEGMEMEVLETMPIAVLQQIDQITVEFHHPFIHPQGQNRERMIELVARLKGAGFMLVMPMRPIFFDALFVNVAGLRLGATHCLSLRLRHDYLARFRRSIRKRFSLKK